MAGNFGALGAPLGVGGNGVGGAGRQGEFSTTSAVGGGVFGMPAPQNGVGERPRNYAPVQPSQRWVIYYSKNGVELQRKMKGPGRLPRGAMLEGDNYIVKDCIVNKNTQEVMTVPLYVPLELRKEKSRTDPESYLGYDMLPANSMAAPMNLARPPQRAVRLKPGGMADSGVDDDNPYAKPRGYNNMRPAEKGPDAEAEPQKGAAAYAKRLKSTYQFPAPVPPEDRDTYDRGFSLLPGGGRGEYIAPKHQMLGEEWYSMSADGSFNLLPPCDPRRAQPPKERPSEVAQGIRVQGYEANDIAAEEDGDSNNELTYTLREREREKESGRGVSAEIVDQVEHADAATILAMWRSLGAPSLVQTNRGAGPENPSVEGIAVKMAEGSGGENGAQARQIGHGAVSHHVVQAESARARYSCDDGEGLNGDKSGGLPCLWLEGHNFSLVEVFRAVRALGGSHKVHCWSLVGEQLLQSRPAATCEPVGGGTGTAAAAASKLGTTTPFADVALRVRDMFAAAKLEQVEARLAAAVAKAAPVSYVHSGNSDIEMGDAAGVGGRGGDKLVVMGSGGVWYEVGEGLVMKDGMLHDEQLVREHGMWQPTPEMLEQYAAFDRTWDAQKRWWTAYQTFARGHDIAAESPNVVVSSACGQHKSFPLFTLYHNVRWRGGMQLLISNKCMSDLLRELECRWTPAFAFELRKMYIRTLYAFEMKELRDLKFSITPAHDLLFAFPIKEKTAHAVVAARQAPLPLGQCISEAQVGL